MAVTMKDVRAVLEPDEPDYKEGAKAWAAAALPHLDALVGGGDTMLASKATYLASLIKEPKPPRSLKRRQRATFRRFAWRRRRPQRISHPRVRAPCSWSWFQIPIPECARSREPLYRRSQPASLRRSLGLRRRTGRDLTLAPTRRAPPAASTGPMPGEVVGEETTMPGEQPAPCRGSSRRCRASGTDGQSSASGSSSSCEPDRLQTPFSLAHQAEEAFRTLFAGVAACDV